MPNHISKPSLRRTILAAAIALAGATGVVAPAGASTGSDGTSNTLMVAAGAVRLDVARHQVVVSARPEALSLNFTKVEFMDYTDDSCMGAARACLIEEEGLYPPAR
jgi:hypothetical protein